MKKELREWVMSDGIDLFDAIITAPRKWKKKKKKKYNEGMFPSFAN